MKMNLGEKLFPNDSPWQRRYKFTWIFGSIAAAIMIVLFVAAAMCQAANTRFPTLKQLANREWVVHAREIK